MKRIIALTIICSAALLGCGKKDKESIPMPTTDSSVSMVEEIVTSLENESSLETETSVEVDTVSEIVETYESKEIFPMMADEYWYESGAGAWGTVIELSSDGSFVGSYHDSDMGDEGDEYPHGTIYHCDFLGEFTEPEPTDKPYIFTMKLKVLKIENEDKLNTEEIIDKTRYVYTTPYGFENADEFLIYLPGAPISEMTEACKYWSNLSGLDKVPTNTYVIYSVGGNIAFH